MGTGALHQADIEPGEPAGRVLAAFRRYLQALPDEQVAWFMRDLPPASAIRRLEPMALPCLGWLARCAEIAPPEAKALVEVLTEQANRLRWGQTYGQEDFGSAFLDNYGWMELFGTRGHFESDVVAGGFLLLGSETHYPDHHHMAEEIYVPLTGGTQWRKGEGAFAEQAAGVVVHHQSNVSHAMRTGSEPLLALYLWRGGPLAQRSEIGRG